MDRHEEAREVESGIGDSRGWFYQTSKTFTGLQSRDLATASDVQCQNYNLYVSMMTND